MRYTYTDAPHASVYTMSAMLAVQMAVWFFVGEQIAGMYWYTDEADDRGYKKQKIIRVYR